uniref:ARID domain-containing protein n=1 Tax=Meloidogyne enterolobii TaxID=390850 RepID=A0A6V7U4D7_MELEN|nr:unnamed protein product [Meloidogyne enterolobii]
MISPMALESLLEGVQNQDVNNTREGQQQQNQNNNFKFCKINEEEKIKENEQIINRKRKLSLNSSTNFDDFNENKNNLINSPNISFQQTILDLAQCEALKNKNNEEKDFNGKLEIGEEEEERNNGDNSSNDLNRQRSHLLEIFEAQKALQRMLSQFVGHQRMFSPSSSSSPSSLPFQQQLADQLSPFLLALNNTNQQQQLETITNNNNIQSTSSTSTELLFSDSSFQNNPFFFPPWQQQKNFFQFSSEKLNKEEIINNSEIFNIDGPEDLTTTKDERESSTTTISELINNGQQQQQQNWSYEDQFKQLYDLSEDTSRKEWLNDWLQFMHKIGKPVTRIPIMAKQVLDLYELYRLVVQHGGLVEVINKKLWREITKGLNLPPSITSAAFTLRTQYSKYLFDYECHRHNFSNIADLQAAVDGNKREGRKNSSSRNVNNNKF